MDCARGRAGRGIFMFQLAQPCISSMRCIYAIAYIYRHICTYIYIYIHTYTLIVYIHIHTYVCRIFIYIYIFILFMYVCICMYICTIRLTDMYAIMLYIPLLLLRHLHTPLAGFIHNVLCLLLSRMVLCTRILVARFLGQLLHHRAYSSVVLLA